VPLYQFNEHLFCVAPPVCLFGLALPNQLAINNSFQMMQNMFIFWVVVGCVSAVEVRNIGNRRVGTTNPAPITCVNPATSGALFGKQIVVSTAAKYAYSVAVGDFNGDGHLDLASASGGDGKIAWYKNTDGLGTFGSQIVVSTAASGAMSVAVGDFNGDGHLDLASALLLSFSWYRYGTILPVDLNFFYLLTGQTDVYVGLTAIFFLKSKSRKI
jgi:hypothetical protein